MPIMGTILDEIYPPEGIFIESVEFDDEELAIDVTCVVPSGSYYMLKPPTYVTAENYVRILSQTSYLLAHHLLEQGLVPVEDVGPEEFAEAAVDHELYYRNLAMTFHEKTDKGVPFRMRLTLKDVRHLVRLGGFILFTFVNERTVISGEMSFVYVCSRQA